jgi:hypothetical protein
LLVLLLLALGLLAGVSVSQTHALHADAAQTETVRLPALLAVNDLTRLLDEQRGLAALHLTLTDAAGRQELEDRLQLGRIALERRIALLGRLVADEEGLVHHSGVSVGLATFLEVQDRLMAASRDAVHDVDAAQRARALLTGEAQQAFLRLRADISAWSAQLEKAAMEQAVAARQAASMVVQVVWALAALAALGLALAIAVAHAPLKAAPTAASDGPDSSLPQRLRSGIDPHLQALNEAVATARRGAPGRGTGLSAQEANALADQLAAAALGLRKLVDRPRTTNTAPNRTPPR